MCWSAQSSLAGFLGTWALCIYLISQRAWRYNAWTGGAMMVVALIQLLEFFAWRHIDDEPKRRSIARLLRPALLLQPAVSWALAAYAMHAPWMLLVAAAYGGIVAWAAVNPQPHADIRRGASGHLAWYADERRADVGILGSSAMGWIYMVGLFVPFVIAFVGGGDATYGLAMFTALSATFGYSCAAYPVAEVSSMWCFWGFLIALTGAAVHFART